MGKVRGIIKTYIEGLRNNKSKYKIPSVIFMFVTIWLALFFESCPLIIRVISGSLGTTTALALVMFRK